MIKFSYNLLIIYFFNKHNIDLFMYKNLKLTY
jgi:hypothetical protein